MIIYLAPTGQPTLGIALCARCSRKFVLADLFPDPNFPGLMVCQEDRDELDPYLLAPRRPDQIVLPFNRPDTNIDTHPSGVIQEAGDEFIIAEDGEEYLEMD